MAKAVKADLLEIIALIEQNRANFELGRIDEPAYLRTRELLLKQLQS